MDSSLRLVKQHIDKDQPFAVLIGSETCSVCASIRPRLEDAFKAEYPLIPFYYLKLENIGTLAAEWMVFSVPAFLLFEGKKELIRNVGVFSLQELFRQLSRFYPYLSNA